jgi:O-acetyl-ADP-ribose deacetylase (regulator of RNase III)
MNNSIVKLVQGDITQYPTDAIITAINSEKLWFGGIDGAIQRAAGSHYHQQVANKSSLKDLDVIVAKGKPHSGKFKDVVFVVDDLRRGLQEIVYAGLEAAHNQDYKSVALPTIRMGVMMGVVEKTYEQTVMRMVSGVKKFQTDHPKTLLEEIAIVVYNDPVATKYLKEGFGI